MSTVRVVNLDEILEFLERNRPGDGSGDVFEEAYIKGYDHAVKLLREGAQPCTGRMFWRGDGE